MKIHLLPKEVYDLISAGEVVLAPVSVVKELVENALDAGASRIIVETVAGGIDRIRVSDNGAGIEKEDIGLAFAPHATSKLANADDLSRIETLGFRGEALASIAAVAGVTLITKTEAETGGTCAYTEGGSLPELSPAGADKGTDITVERLFFNIPARKKHLGDARAEGRKITEYLGKAAVSRPDVAFRLISDGALVFSTLGNGDRLSAIAAIYGSKTAENLVPVSANKPDMRLNGYISGVLGLRGNKKGQHLYVNGRPVSHAAIDAALGRAYREFAEPGKFPVVFLFLEADPAMIDVNVHPTKSEVAFVNTSEISDFVHESVLETLRSERAIPKLKSRNWPSLDKTFVLEPTRVQPIEEEIASGDKEILVSTYGGDAEKVESVYIDILLSTNTPLINDNIVNIAQSPQYGSMVDDNKLQSFSESTDSRYAEMLKIDSMQLLACLFATYILAADGDALYVIDQHAAHERVNYERLRKAFYSDGTTMQELLTPFVFTLPSTVGDLSKYLDFFAKLGYQIEEFGEKTWAARTFPAYISQTEAEAFLLGSLDAIGEEKEKGQYSQAALERIMTRACKSSVKANQALSPEERKTLLDELSKCENPFTCPHGRPVFLKLTRPDIERLFKRA